MSITYGVTEVGFVAKPLDVVKSELDDRFKTNILGQSAGTEPDGSIPGASVAGQIIAAMVDGTAGQWDQQQAIYASFDPNSAVDAAQDALCAQTGTVRDKPVQSIVTATCTGTPNTPLNPGRAATVEGTGARFLSRDAATITAVAAWLATHGYIVGDRVTNGGNVYVCTDPGTSAGSGGPTGTGSGIVDGGAIWDFVGQGTGAVDVVYLSEVNGPIAALAGELDTIATPVSGWQSITNLLDATVGALLEGNTPLRIRREVELTSDGLATPDAIRAHVSAVGEGTVNAVKACTVFYNDGDSPDANGLPAHSVEVLVLGGLDADVAQAVWESVGGGIATYGTTTVVVNDSQGNPQTVNFSRPTQIQVYVVANVLYDQTAGAFPADGATEIQNALLTFGATYAIGRDVRASALASAVFDGPTSTDPGATPCPGILDVSPLYIGTAPAPGTSSPITITSRQIAVFDSSRITVNLTGGTP